MSHQDNIRNNLGNDRLIALLREVDLETAQANGDHIADDPELLERWDNQLLTGEEHDAVLKHLAVCHECSQFLHDMNRAGVFGGAAAALDSTDAKHDVFKKTMKSSEPSLSHLAEPPHESGTRSTRWFAMTTVACALVAVVGFLISRGGNNPAPVRLAQADFGQLLHYLHEADFAAVVVPGEIKSGSKPYPVLPDADRDAGIRRLTDLVKREPRDLTHRLNLGQLMLEAGRHEDALAEFQTAKSIDSGSAFGQLGLGLAQFRSGDIVAAERTFSRIEDDSVVGADAKVNRVLCLMALDRKNEARKLWATIPSDAQNARVAKMLAVEIE